MKKCAGCGKKCWSQGSFCASCKRAYRLGSQGNPMVGPTKTNALAVLKLIKSSVSGRWMGGV